MDFGLGLILSFTDNATSGIQSAVTSLNSLTSTAESASNTLSNIASLSAFSSITNNIGSSLMNVGSNILGLYEQVINKVRDTGQEFENFDTTLTALYGGGAEGAKKSQQALGKLFDFAKKSPLEVGDVKDMIVTLQSQGVDAFAKTTGSITGTRQEFLAFLTDLKSFKPEVSNMRFKMAIQNYVGSGEKKMMRTVFDMGDIEEIIGHKMSTTAEGRMNDIIEMVEKKGLTGLSSAMSNTWTGVASNIEDAFTQIYYSIASNGVFDKLKDAFVDLANTIINLDTKQLANIGKNIADGLNMVITPVTKAMHLLAGLADVIVKITETNPLLTKFVIVLGAVGGSLLVLAGVALKVMSSLGYLSLMLQTFNTSFSIIGTTLVGGLKSVIATLAPLAVAIGLLYLAWSRDFGGIRTILTDFATDVYDSFGYAQEIMNSSLGSFQQTIADMMQNTDKMTFFGNLTLGLVKLGILFRALAEGWNNYTLSEDTFLKAKQLGILPLIEAIFDLKYRFELFKEGFKQGWKEISDKVKEVVTNLIGYLGNGGGIFDTLLDGITKFLRLLGDNDADAWKDLGETFGKMTAKLVLAGVALKIFNDALGKISTLVKGIGNIGAIFSGIGGVLGGIGSAILKVLGGTFSSIRTLLLTLLNSFFGSSIGSITTHLRIIGAVIYDTVASIMSGIMGVVGKIFAPITRIVLRQFAHISMVLKGIVSAISLPFMAVVAIITLVVASVVTYAVTKWEDFKAKLLTVWETLKSSASTIWGAIQSGFSTIWDSIQTSVGFVTEKFGELKGKFDETAEAFTNSTFGQFIIFALSSIGQIIVGTIIPLFNGLLTTVATALSGIINVVSTVFSAIINIIGSLLGNAIGVVSGILQILTGIFSLNFEQVKTGAYTIFTSLVSLVGTLLTSLISVATSIVGALANFLVSAFTGIVATIGGFVTSLFGAGEDIVNGLLNGIKSVWDSITSFFSNAVSDVISFVKGLFGVASPSTIFAEIGGFLIEGLLQGLNNALSGVTEFFTGMADGIITSISELPSKVGDIATSIGSAVSGAWDGLTSTVSSIWGGIKDTVSNAWDTIKSKFSGGNDASSQASSAFSQIESATTSSWGRIQSAISNSYSKIQSIVSSLSSSMSSVITNTWSTIGNSFSTGANGITNITNTLKTTISTSATSMQTTMTNSFSRMASSVSSSMGRALSSVTTSLNSMKTAFANTKLQLPQNHISLPHFSVSGSFSANPPSVPSFSVSWHKRGGVFDEPSIIGVGEAGKEAVVPLENNLGWISQLASNITSQMSQMTPTSSNIVTPTNNNVTNNQQYMTTSSGGSVSNDNSTTDNSVVIQTGAIQIIAKDSSAEEAERLADKILEIIKRKQQIQNMLSYNS